MFRRGLGQVHLLEPGGPRADGPGPTAQTAPVLPLPAAEVPLLTPNFEFENISSRKLQALGASADLQKGLTLDKVQAAYQR